MHFILVFENLKQFSVAHLLILLMRFVLFFSRVGIYFDLSLIEPSSPYRDPYVKRAFLYYMVYFDIAKSG